MKLFLVLMVFCSGAMANRLVVEISSSTNEEINKTLSFNRPPETMTAFNRNKQFFNLGINDIKCDVSFFESKAAIGCEQTKDNKGRVTADSGFQVATSADCDSGKESEMSFSNKIKKNGYWASVKIKIKCVQEKI